MAAATQVPASPWPGKGWINETLDRVNLCVTLGIVSATSETVAVLITHLTSEQGDR